MIDDILPPGKAVPAARMADVQYLRGVLALRRGLPAEALEHLRTAGEVFERVGCPISLVLCHIHIAHAHLLMERLPEAHSQLQRAERLNWGGSRFCAYLGLLGTALVSFRLDEKQTGMEALGTALSIGSQYGIRIQPFWDPQAMAPLCARALEAGLEPDFVVEHIRRHRLLVPGDHCPVAAWPWPVKVHTFGGFELQLDGRPLQSSGKVQKKPLDMLKVLVASGETGVSQEQIADALWPDAEADAAHRSFKFTLHQLRKLLGNDACIQIRDGHVDLDYQLCYTDVRAFRYLMELANELLRRRPDGWEERLLRIADRIAAIYQGQFLGDDRSAPWIAVARERFTGSFLRLVETICACHEEDNRWEQAALLYERVLEIHEYDEEIHRRLILCLLNLDRPSAAMAAYNRCRRALAHHLGIAPTRETEELSRAAARLVLPSGAAPIDPSSR